MKKLYLSLKKISTDISWLGLTITFTAGFLLAISIFWLFGSSIRSLLVSFIL
ncbi:MAG TPA: hypothetical protein VGZ71_00050 [Puia sp.]|nr:hypothetical protein [Puia sp.]